MSDRVMDRTAQAFVRTETNKQKKQGQIEIVAVTVDEAAAAAAKEEDAGHEPSVRVLLRGVRPSTRVHVTSSHFAPVHVSSKQPLAGAHTDGSMPTLPRVQPYSQPRSSYLRSARLGDEEQHTLDRQAVMVAAGDARGKHAAAARPPLLLHPHARSEAHFDAAPKLRDRKQMQTEASPVAQPLMADAFHQPRMFANGQGPAAKMSVGSLLKATTPTHISSARWQQARR